jgi:SAM-dependent methyltransferase
VHEDTRRFVDDRPFLDVYRERSGRRIARRLQPRGGFFLDAGCGALPQTGYSAAYRWHVCLDVSLGGLRAARERLGERGLFVVGDLARLPFRDGAFDSTLCAHALYHVHRDEQAAAVRELQRTLSAAGRCVIAYRRPRGWLEELARRVGRRRGRGGVSRSGAPPAAGPDARRAEPAPSSFYFHAHGLGWFRRVLPPGSPVEVLCGPAVGTEFTKAFVRDNALGRLLLGVVAALEDAFPAWMARVGLYPLVVLRNPVAPEGR